MERTMHHPPLNLHMGEEAQDIYIKASKQEFAYRLAKECMVQINSAGGIGCTKEGVILVAKKILEICNNV